MKTKDINNLIEELDNEICYWRDTERLFNGGCCFSAYLLAKGFEKLGIKYSIVMYQDGPNWNTNKFNRICVGDGCAHIAISVVYKHRKMIIGSDDEFEKIMKDLFSWSGRFKIREYTKVNSDDLVKIYNTNSWNPMWRKRKNKILKEVIIKIFEKYI